MRTCIGLLAAALVSGCGEVEVPQDVLDLATTTSVRDSGLLDHLLPGFTEETGIRVRLLVVGSGAALRLGKEGDVDALLTHAPEGELALVSEGWLTDRTPVMENFFVIAGPPEDPAGIAGLPDAPTALRRLAEADAPFVSRGDDSGTHRRERALMEQAGVDPETAWPAVVRTHAGMGQSLQVAGDRRAYVLSDVGTFRSFRARTGLVQLSRSQEPALRNVYSVSRPAPGRHPSGHVNVVGAVRFRDFLLDPEVQRRIGAFGTDTDGPLFRPLHESPS